MTSFIDDLREDGLAVDDLTRTGSAKPAAKARETFPCESCRGTGRYQGVRIHQPEEKCFACGGKGYFFKSYADRMKARQQTAARKQAKVELAQTQFTERYPDLIAKVRADLLPWNKFAVELIEQFDTKGSLSDKQAEALWKQIEKAAERQAARQAEKQTKANELTAKPVDTSAIRGLFDVAKSNGLKKPGLWFGDLKISEAPANGRNGGALYVKQNGEYVGKIVGATFHPAWQVKYLPILEDLLKIAAEPAEQLRIKGKETGRCCCCGRELSDPESVAAGIGPICASNWGL